MALRPVFVIFIKLSVFFCSVRSCAVSCTTDYKSFLNCSCPDLEPSEELKIQVVCSYDDLTINSSCLVSAQQHFCVMYPEIMEEIADMETVCRTSAVRRYDHSVITESSEWRLRDAVRPSPPFNIIVNNTGDTYKITWDKQDPRLCLTYRVHIRPNSRSPHPGLTLNSTQPSVHIPQSLLHPGVCYRMELQAQLCPGFMYRGPRSEWSTPSSCFSAVSPQAEGTHGYYWLATLPFVMVLLSLAFSKKVFGHKRLQLMTYSPDPSEFFKPLYNTHQGNFKAWVMPVFTEQDYLTVDSVLDVKLDQWNQCCFLHPPPYHPTQSHSPSHSPSQSRGSSQVSIHTVTLCGSLGYPDEELAEVTEVEERLQASLEDLSLSSQVIGQDEEGLSELDEEGLSADGYPHMELDEEGLSADGYPHMELDEEGLSADGYPHMDLDTIDSGFGECSSPPASGCRVEQLCELYQSNYVKQWTMDSCECDSDLLTSPQSWR